MNPFDTTSSGGAPYQAPGTMTPSNPLVRSADHLDDDDDDMPGGSRLRTEEDINPTITGPYSSNLRTLRTTEPTQDARDFMRRYFSNLVGIKPGLIKMYFDKSCLTFDGIEVMGDNFIIMQLAKLRACPFYDIKFLSAQPTLGNGIFIIVKGNTPNHTFHMNMNIVSVKKKYRILNQYIEINPNPVAPAAV
jgi:hypothetical protein